MNTEIEPSVELANQGERSWTELVDRVRRGETSGMEELYQVFSKGIRFYLYRHLGPQDLDDRVHDLFVTITQSIQRGDLREPERLMGYVRTVTRRQVAAHIDTVQQARRNQTDLEYGIPLSDMCPNPEGRVIQEESVDLAMRLLNSLNRRDREVLMRFYLKEQTPEQICTEMDLTGTQFRLIKSRAKARFGELGKRRLAFKVPISAE